MGLYCASQPQLQHLPIRCVCLAFFLSEASSIQSCQAKFGVWRDLFATDDSCADVMFVIYHIQWSCWRVCQTLAEEVGRAGEDILNVLDWFSPPELHAEKSYGSMLVHIWLKFPLAVSTSLYCSAPPPFLFILIPGPSHVSCAPGHSKC